MKIKCVRCNSEMGEKHPFGGLNDKFTRTVVFRDKDGDIAVCLLCKLDKIYNSKNNNSHDR